MLQNTLGCIPLAPDQASVAADEPGNEDGYVVKMTDDDLATPYKIAPGTRVRLESLYEGDNRLLVRHAAYHSDCLFVF